MLNAIRKHHAIIAKWMVDVYEREANIFRFKARIVFKNGSLLRIKEYRFSDGTRKYSYHWETGKGVLITRWDNAPHWHKIASHPHHKHVQSAGAIESSGETHLDAVLEVIANNIKVIKNK
ncbi:MAG: DUF6516 family protein [Smithellaceae bacterium]